MSPGNKDGIQAKVLVVPSGNPDLALVNAGIYESINSNGLVGLRGL